MAQEYNVLTIIKLTDNFGNTFYRDQMRSVHDGGIMMLFSDDARFYLRPGDTLTLEIEVDPSYPSSEYTIKWASTKYLDVANVSSPRVVIPIINRYVGREFDIQCHVATNRDWHRMNMGADDFLIMNYRVLPPLS